MTPYIDGAEWTGTIGKGAIRLSPTGEVIKLQPDDLDDLDKLQEQRSSIKRIRDHHHLIARLVAEGRRTTDIAQQVGLSVSRVSILKGDPAFQQLVEMYRVNINQIREAAFAGTETKAAFAYNEMLDDLIDILLEDPASLSPDIKLRVMDHLADRIGFVKGTKNLTLSASVKLDSLADLVAARRRRADQLSAPTIRDANEPELDQHPAPAQDRRIK